MQTIPSRVQKCLVRWLIKKQNRPGLFDGLSDPRQQGKITHELPSIVSALLLGLVANRRTLREVEALTWDLGRTWRYLVPKAISDTTMEAVLRKLSWQQLQERLVTLVRQFHRSKLLRPLPGLPVNLMAIDGKNLATLDHSAQGSAQPRGRDNSKWQNKRAKDTADATYWLAPALRATLVSTEARPCVLQMPLPPTGNASGSMCSASMPA